MDHYAKYEQALTNLRHEMVNSIRSIFFDRGYEVGELANGIIVSSDRTFIVKNGIPYHTDNLSTEDLLEGVRKAMHIIYK